MQVIHEDDWAEAIAHSLTREVRGDFNLTGSGQGFPGPRTSVVTNSCPRLRFRPSKAGRERPMAPICSGRLEKQEVDAW